VLKQRGDIEMVGQISHRWRRSCVLSK
jgi:hypothetical protein